MPQIYLFLISFFPNKALPILPMQVFLYHYPPFYFHSNLLIILFDGDFDAKEL